MLFERELKETEDWLEELQTQMKPTTMVAESIPARMTEEKAVEYPGELVTAEQVGMVASAPGGREMPGETPAPGAPGAQELYAPKVLLPVASALLAHPLKDLDKLIDQQEVHTKHPSLFSA